MTNTYLNHTRNERGRYRDALHWLRTERTPEYAIAGIEKNPLLEATIKSIRQQTTDKTAVTV